jgi:hypothetical protein
VDATPRGEHIRLYVRLVFTVTECIYEADPELVRRVVAKLVIRDEPRKTIAQAGSAA